MVIINIEQNGNKVKFYPCSEMDFRELWIDYFDLETDYTKIKKIISKDDPIMQKAVEFASGIRLLNQEPFETLISFIISQNNNIPRIKGIINRLSEKFGTTAEGGSYFPKLEELCGVGNDDYMALGTGFRAKYLCDCISRLEKGEIVLSDIEKFTTEEVGLFFC